MYQALIFTFTVLGFVITFSCHPKSTSSLGGSASVEPNGKEVWDISYDLYTYNAISGDYQSLGKTQDFILDPYVLKKIFKNGDGKIEDIEECRHHRFPNQDSMEKGLGVETKNPKPQIDVEISIEELSETPSKLEALFGNSEQDLYHLIAKDKDVGSYVKLTEEKMNTLFYEEYCGSVAEKSSFEISAFPHKFMQKHQRLPEIIALEMKPLAEFGGRKPNIFLVMRLKKYEKRLV